MRELRYTHYKNAEKEKLFHLVDERGTRVRAAILSLDINVCTVQGWVAKNNKAPQEHIQRVTACERLVGGPLTLADEHKDFVNEWADKSIDSVTLDDMLKVLTGRFGKLFFLPSTFTFLGLIGSPISIAIAPLADMTSRIVSERAREVGISTIAGVPQIERALGPLMLILRPVSSTKTQFYR